MENLSTRFLHSTQGHDLSIPLLCNSIYGTTTWIFWQPCGNPYMGILLGGLEAVVGYEGTTESGIGWYVAGGPTATHTETADEFGDVEFIGYLGGSYDKFYGEISGVTAEDDVDWAGKVGVKFTF